MPMFLYVTVGTNDLARSVAFYDALFAALGEPRLPDWTEGWAGWGKEYDEGIGFWLCPPFDGAPATPGNGTMFAFPCPDALTVRSAWNAAMAAGGMDEGGPGLRPQYGARFYAAYLRDPEGNKIALVHHRYDAAEALV
jgi:catechol 2,3-dioxygenase-like lactoylglutathione lyase family enzyme